MRVVLTALLLTALTLNAELDRFDRGAAGSLPAGWTMAMTHAGGSPRWAIVRDPSAPSPLYLLAQFENGTRTSIAPNGSPSRSYGVKHDAPKGRWNSLRVVFHDQLHSVFLDLPPVLRQPVKTQNPSNGELSHGIVS
jgi:hypothetical protein